MDQSKIQIVESENGLKSKIIEIEKWNSSVNDTTNSLSSKIDDNIKAEIVQIEDFKEETLENCKNFKGDLLSLYLDIRRNIIKYQEKIDNYNDLVPKILLLIILLIVITGINAILTIYQPISSYYPFINALIIGISIFLLILAISNTRKLFQMRKELNSKGFNSFARKFDEIHLNSNQTEIHKENYDEIFCKKSISQVLYTLRRVITSSEETIPLVKLFYEQYRKKANWDIICEDIQNSLKYYKLDCQTEVDQINKYPPWKSEIADNDKFREKIVLQNLAEKYQDRGFGVNYQILSVLVSHYKGKNTKNLWDEIISNPESLQIFAQIIFESELLEFDKNIINLPEFIHITRSCEEFNLNELFQRCLLYQQLISEIILINNKIENLGFSLKNRYHQKDLIKIINFSEDFETNFLRILSQELSESIPFEGNVCYVNAIMAILLNPDYRFKQQVCQRASEPESVVILMGYLQIKRGKEESRISFQLSDLIEENTLYSSIKSQVSRENEEYDPEKYKRYETYKTALQNGRWITDEIFLIQETVLRQINEVSENFQKNKKYRTLHKIIEKNFENININIVDKAIDANLFSTYVILTHSLKYPLMDTINKLNAYNLTEIEIKDIESTYGICLLKDKMPKYHFKKYLKGTYVGVIEKNDSFTQFNEEFLSDLRQILKKDEIIHDDPYDWNFGLTILKITPSKYSFGMLPEYLTSKDVQIAKIISELVNNAGILKISEKATLEIFDKNIDLLEIINQQSIFDLISFEGQTISKNYESFLNSDALRDALFQRLREEEIYSFKDLAIDIGYHDSQSYFYDIIAEVFANQYKLMMNRDLNNKKLNDFTADFVASLEAAATLWER